MTAHVKTPIPDFALKNWMKATGNAASREFRVL
jgi:hypothetical protein